MCGGALVYLFFLLLSFNRPSPLFHSSSPSLPPVSLIIMQTKVCSSRRRRRRRRDVKVFTDLQRGVCVFIPLVAVSVLVSLYCIHAHIHILAMYGCKHRDQRRNSAQPGTSPHALCTPPLSSLLHLCHSSSLHLVLIREDQSCLQSPHIPVSTAQWL